MISNHKIIRMIIKNVLSKIKLIHISWNRRQPNAKIGWNTFPQLVFTYIVWGRLSVMHKPFAVHRICVRIVQRAPLWRLECQTREPPPPQEMENFRFELTKVWTREPPPNEKLSETSNFSWSKFGPEIPPFGTCVGTHMWRLILYPHQIPSSFYGETLNILCRNKSMMNSFVYS